VTELERGTEQDIVELTQRGFDLDRTEQDGATSEPGGRLGLVFPSVPGPDAPPNLPAKRTHIRGH
jgi:hypothetical protein